MELAGATLALLPSASPAFDAAAAGGIAAAPPASGVESSVADGASAAAGRANGGGDARDVVGPCGVPAGPGDGSVPSEGVAGLNSGLSPKGSPGRKPSGCSVGGDNATARGCNGCGDSSPLLRPDASSICIQHGKTHPGSSGARFAIIHV